MADLEKIIRPFETRTVAPTILPPNDTTPPENVVLTFGQNSASGGGGKSGNRTTVTVGGTSGSGTKDTSTGTGGVAKLTVIGHYSNSVTCYMTKQEREKGVGDPLGLRGFKTGHI